MGYRAGAVPGQPGVVLAAAAVLRPDRARDRRGDAMRLSAARARAVGILQANRSALDEGAAALLARESLEADELPKVVVEVAKAAE